MTKTEFVVNKMKEAGRSEDAPCDGGREGSGALGTNWILVWTEVG